MENLSHSRPPVGTLSKKSACNGASAPKNMYDDVFGGPPRFGAPTLSPRIEDYAEIFGGLHSSSRASSIPVLDLPSVDEDDEVFFDVRSCSGFDYGEVFGGFNSSDFAVSYEELVMMADGDQSNGRRSGASDDDEAAWSPAEADYLSEESDHSEKSECLLNGGDSYELADGDMEFNISYHRAAQRSNEEMSNGTTHIAHLHSVPGYSFIVDKVISLPKIDDEFLPPRMSDDDHINIELSAGTIIERPFRKTLSQPANGGNGRPLFGDDDRTYGRYARNGSFPNKSFITISDVSLKTLPSQVPPPSRPPPPPALDVKLRDSGKLIPNARNDPSEEAACNCSPPYFDVEVDATSSAAVSAAAIKEAMEKAQVKLKSAKQLMDRKREGFQGRTKSGSKDFKKDKEGNFVGTMNGFCTGRDDRVWGMHEKEDGIETSSTEARQNGKKANQLIPDSMEGDKHRNVAKREEKEARQSLSSQGSDRIDGASEWKEATEFFELVTNTTPKAFDHANGDSNLDQKSNIIEHGKKEKKAFLKSTEQQQENDMKGKTGRADKGLEACEESNGRPEAAEVGHREKRLEKKMKGAHGTSREKENEKKFRIDGLPVVTENKQTKVGDSLEHENIVERHWNEHKLEVKETTKHKEKVPRAKEANKCLEDEREFTSEIKDCDRRQREAIEQLEHEKIKAALQQSKIDRRLKEGVLEQEKEKRRKDVHEREEIEKKLREAHEREENDRRLMEALEKQENERRLKKTLQEENERRLREALEKEENERRRLREALEKEENERRRIREALEKQENERRLKETLEKEENARRQREAAEQEENEKRQKEAAEWEESEKRQREAAEQENEKRQREAAEREEKEKRQREAHEREENEKRLKEALKKKENEKREREESEKRLKREAYQKEQKEAHEREETEKRCRETFEKEENSERGGIAKRCEVNIEKEESSKILREAQVGKESEEGRNGTDNQGEIENASQVTQKGEAHFQEANESKELAGLIKMGKKYSNYSSLNHTYKLDENNNPRATEVDGKHEGTCEMGTNEEVDCEENRKVEIGWRNIRNKADNKNRDVLVDEKKEVSDIAQHNLEHEKKQFPSEVALKVPTEDENLMKVGAAKHGTGQGNVASEKGAAVENQRKNCVQARNEKGSKIEESQVSKDRDGKTRIMNEPVVTGRKMEAAQPATFDVKGSTHRTAQQVNGSQNAERKVKISNETTITFEEKETERVKREKEMEMERLRKIEEEREREREREKDRMAVDVATACEKAFSEVREKAERAAMERAIAEARQRAMNEARERLEKACAEAREKSLGDKTSMEARLRAERAAVERATAEARERAFEKAMAERTAFEARERVERSVSDKFSASSRSTGMRPSSSSSDLQDLQYQSAGSFNGSRYPYSSVCSGPYNPERSGVVEAESPQRCKARLERHQRTAERAAKALEEKNMRDLLAQREQAERNRISETLDAEVRRWSSGKEGNLRALLSTLQYILGPDSGWQPVPLTEVITSAAVKKAYRKATLCVHPDKLQQRGASIHQKYICEKVFDLLKEAWNKFNSEER